MTIEQVAVVSEKALHDAIRMLTVEEGRKSARTDTEVETEVCAHDTTTEERVEGGDEHQPSLYHQQDVPKGMPREHTLG